MNRNILGVWCGAGSKLTVQAHGLSVLERTRKRIGPHFLLIPWLPDLDWMEGIGPANRRRCHPDERIAMRDLVVELGAEAGALIHGDCLTIDREEIALAFAAIQHGHSMKRGGAKPLIEPSGPCYFSPRVQAFGTKDWLCAFDTDEWGPYPLNAEDLRTLSPKDLEMRWARIRGSK